MPFDSNGVFTRVMNWTSDQQNGIAIECGRHDQEDDNFAEGFNDTFCRDGRAAATGDFNLGQHKVKNLANGTTSTDAVNKGQLDTKATPAQVTSSINSMLESLYPVGSVYIGTQATCPLATLISGSQWQLVAQDRALWGGNGSNANSTINAGLPNITGNIRPSVENTGSDYADGAFNRSAVSSTAVSAGYQTRNVSNYNFDASRSNSIYGSSSTVQPPAYRVNVWRRTA